MTNTTISTLSSSIDVIQLKLSDCSPMKIDFEKTIEERLQTVETPSKCKSKTRITRKQSYGLHTSYLSTLQLQKDYKTGI
jgi:hypothetical protein